MGRYELHTVNRTIKDLKPGDIFENNGLMYIKINKKDTAVELSGKINEPKINVLFEPDWMVTKIEEEAPKEYNEYTVDIDESIRLKIENSMFKADIKHYKNLINVLQESLIETLSKLMKI